MKLLNSYGFGLCYHIAPLLQAVYDAAGFEDARERAGTVSGPPRGPVGGRAAKELARGEHGSWNAVAGAYGYLLRLNLGGGAVVRKLRLTSRFQPNMRAMAPVQPGKNEFTYEPGPRREGWELPVRLDKVERTAKRISGARYVQEDQNGLLLAAPRKTAEMVFLVKAPDGSPLSEVDAGGRFLDLRDGIAPEKRTAETRPTKLAPAVPAETPSATLEWSLSPDGPYRPLWSYDPAIAWKDGKAYPRVLRWPEVDRRVTDLPAGTAAVYLKYRFRGIAIPAGCRGARKIGGPKVPKMAAAAPSRDEKVK